MAPRRFPGGPDVVRLPTRSCGYAGPVRDPQTPRMAPARRVVDHGGLAGSGPAPRCVDVPKACRRTVAPDERASGSGRTHQSLHPVRLHRSPGKRRMGNRPIRVLAREDHARRPGPESIRQARAAVGAGAASASSGRRRKASGHGRRAKQISRGMDGAGRTPADPHDDTPVIAGGADARPAARVSVREPLDKAGAAKRCGRGTNGALRATKRVRRAAAAQLSRPASPPRPRARGRAAARRGTNAGDADRRLRARRHPSARASRIPRCAPRNRRDAGSPGIA